MYAASRVLTELNLETRIHHAEVDADQLAVLDRIDLEGYREYLIKTYGFEASAESAIALAPDIDRAIDLRERAKAGLLATDLLTLGLRPHELSDVPLCTGIAACDTLEEALGWLYVVERRTLLHAAMLRYMTTRLPAVVETSTAFLRCYDGVAGARWRDLGAVLDHVNTTTRLERILEAAHHAFWCQRDWFRREGSRQATG